MCKYIEKFSRLFIVHSIFRDVFIQAMYSNLLVNNDVKRYILYIKKVVYVFGDSVKLDLIHVLFIVTYGYYY